MPEKRTLQRARRDQRQGKAPTTQAGEFIREELHHIREGKHGARSAKQAVAIGLSKARRSGVDLPPPEKGTVPEKTRRSAKRAYERARKRGIGEPESSAASPRRKRAAKRALKREPRAAASRPALARRGATSITRATFGGRAQGGAHAFAHARAFGARLNDQCWCLPPGLVALGVPVSGRLSAVPASIP